MHRQGVKMTNNHEKLLPYDGLYWVVEDALFLKEYQVKLWFRDGSIKIVDFEKYLFSRKEGSVFEPLKDKALFASVQYSEEISEHSTQEPSVTSLQHISEKNRDEVDGIVQVLAHITHSSPEKIKPYIDTLLRQLMGKQEEPPFHETATVEEWIASFQAWAANHHHDAAPCLIMRLAKKSIYERLPLVKGQKPELTHES
jgi:Protein of unknown function (DUF2442)